MGVVRLLLAVAVVLAHSTPIAGIKLCGGRTAVECFFVISGFYMAMVIDRKYSRLARHQWRTFITARIGRLWPLYLLIAALSICAVSGGWSLVAGPQPQQIQRIPDLPALEIVYFVVINIIVLGQDLTMFQGVSSTGHVFWTPDFGAHTPAYLFTVVPQAWTVSLEVVFYLCAPWLARRSTRTLVALMGGSLLVRAVLAVAGYYNSPWDYRFLPSEMIYFLAGMVAYRLSRRLRAREGGLVLAVVVVAIAASQLATKLPGPLEKGFAFAFPLAFALAVPSIFSFTAGSKIDRWVGELSYPVYLVHILVIAGLAAGGFSTHGWAAVPASVAAAVVLGYLFDRPLERLRQRRIDRKLAESNVPIDPAAGVLPVTEHAQASEQGEESPSRAGA